MSNNIIGVWKDGFEFSFFILVFSVIYLGICELIKLVVVNNSFLEFVFLIVFVFIYLPYMCSFLLTQYRISLIIDSDSFNDEPVKQTDILMDSERLKKAGVD